MKNVSKRKKLIAAASVILFLIISISHKTVTMAGHYTPNSAYDKYATFGGGYAASGQIAEVGYTTEVYDASNGLPTSDTMYIMGASDGSIWMGGYSGVIKYDGSVFERMDTAKGLTSARAIFEDSKGRIWVGTNDNGVVVIDGENSTHFTYKDGLPSSSIRIFEEDLKGNIFIGTTAGVCYIDSKNQVHELYNNFVSGERVLKLDAAPNGLIFGQTANGIIFSILDCKITKTYASSDLNMSKITTLLADPEQPGKLYIGTEGGYVYYGDFGSRVLNLERIRVSPIDEVHWLSYDCGRVWVSSINQVGYLDNDRKFSLLTNIPFNSGIEMTTADYQGNIWAASSTQGAMKLVTNNFVDVTDEAGLKREVTNTVCIYDNCLYIGTDKGIEIINRKLEHQDNRLKDFLGEARIRSMQVDDSNNLWVATYTNDVGLVCFNAGTGSLTSYTTANGLPDNHVRCIAFSDDGKVYAGTNGGLAVIKDGAVRWTVGAKEGIINTVFLTLCTMEDGSVLAGSDGDGLYMIKGKDVYRVGRDDGLTSDVVMRVKWDEVRDVHWIITSNSIEYFKDGKVKAVTTFPYNNNYDLYFDREGNAWILSSYGIYVVKADDMIKDNITDYRLYTVENGLPYAITGNSFGTIDEDGQLFIPGRNGVIKVNINKYYETNEEIRTAIKYISCGDMRITADKEGVFRIPAADGRIQIAASVMDYTMLNPTVHVFLEGGRDEGITAPRSNLTSLEYTGLPYGNYTLHIQILDKHNDEVIQDDTYRIVKSPKVMELLLVRVLIGVTVAAVVGFAVWRVMRSTVVNRQYEEIRNAKEEAERANTAKSRFLANISHEIRTPINTIMGMNEMIMREDASNVPKSYFLSMMNYSLDIKNASESLLSLINDLLDMSKIESGKMHLVEQEYDVLDTLRSIVSMIRGKSTEKELTFDVVVDELLPKRMYGDAGKIKQIVLNLLTNAVKYTDKGGISLNVDMTERKGDVAMLRFSVIDTGMGVKEEDKEKLFSAYERLDEVKNSSIQGTGLGLDISRKFAELMEGKLWCESTYGEGSEFILTINQKIVDATPLGAFIEHDQNAASGPYIPQFIAPDADVLVVDDNSMNLNVIKGLLKATKVFVTTSSSGEDALGKLKDNHFDVVLLDHMMPGMDGIETVSKIREFLPDLPVYALTANSTAGEEFYKSKGFNGYLSKPVDSLTLEKTIMKHLPEEMMEKPSSDFVVEEITELPDNMLWVKETDGINADEGIANSGGVMNYIYALKLFLDTIDDNSRVIKDAYDADNIRLYTIKVHALKSSARIIGAQELSKLCADLEDAGNREDKEFIDANTEKLLKDYAGYKEKLSRMKEEEKDDSGLEEIPESELKGAYEALNDVIPQMDYDSVEMILEGLKGYRLPKEEAEKMSELEKLLKTFDWDAMEKLMGIGE